MSNGEYIALVDRLRPEPIDTEWLEFKADRYEPQAIGEYLSALDNGARLCRQTIINKPNIPNKQRNSTYRG